MRTNYLSPVAMSLAVLPRMLERDHGVIVNVSSLGGRIGIAHEAAYVASKFALSGWSEAMAMDLWSTGVEVRLVTPGAIDTEIWDQPGNDPAPYDGPFEPPDHRGRGDLRRPDGRPVRDLRPRPEGRRRVQDQRHRRVPGVGRRRS